jgi:rhamnulokinase
MYRDDRTDGVMDRVFARVPRREVFQATGLQFMQFNTLFQLYSMKEANSPALQAAASLLFMPDLFNYLLCGRQANEFSIASTSQMYDPRRRQWATDLLRQLDLPAGLLGQIVPSGTVLANLKPDVAAECGAKPAPVIAPGCHDTASAVASVPAQGDSWCYISSGTWSLMGVELDQPIVNDKALAHNYTNEGGVGGSIRFLKNIMGLWPVQECRRHWQSQGQEYSYAQLVDAALAAAPFIAVLNLDHPPFLKPGQMPEKITDYCRATRQPAPANVGQTVRTVLESLALAYRHTLQGLEEVLGRKIAVIHIVGGGCQNELLNQMTADACARPVITGPVEATAAGNILTQAMAVGQIKDLSELRSIIRNSFELKRYEPRQPAAWEKAYARYREMLAM